MLLLLGAVEPIQHVYHVIKAGFRSSTVGTKNV